MGVSGRYYHNLDPAGLGATVIPFWEMVYHDCQICYGKYGYAADRAGQYVAHHVLCARPLNYHSIPDHRYWLEPAKKDQQKRGEKRADERAKQPIVNASCFARTDRGWAEGFCPTDAFLKTTQEVLGPLNEATAHDRLTRLEFLTPDRTLRRAVYGESAQGATVVVVNFGLADASVECDVGGNVLLPPWGFVVNSPRFTAFYAKRFAGREYPEGALFTLKTVEGTTPGAGDEIRIFHGFGDPNIHWNGQTREVRRGAVIPGQP